MFGINTVFTIPSAANVTLANFSNLFQADSTAPWWLLWLLLIIGVLSLVATWISQITGKRAASTSGGEVGMAAQAVQAEASPTVETTPSPDDLTRIEGIGPKISSLLKDAGITTFSQLAATETSRLEEILQEAKLRLADPETWPEQAGLAATGEWEALQVLQNELKGGRRED